jgi:serine/threonine-protein kinase
MDLFPHGTLQQRLRRTPLAPARVANLSRQLLFGIGAIHRAGMLHLDIKTSNVMLDDAGSTERAVIVDFGLCRPSSERRSPEQEDHLSGTLGYMAPEVLLGQTPSVQADIFSFGVVLFEMLTGHLPYVGAAGPIESLAAQRLTSLPRLPSEVARTCPPNLERIVSRCLATRSRRYHDVDCVLRDLDA